MWLKNFTPLSLRLSLRLRLTRPITQFNFPTSQISFSSQQVVDQFPKVVAPQSIINSPGNPISSKLFFSCEAPQKLVHCWNCNDAVSSSSTTPFLVCNACGSIQPVDHSLHYFHIFGLEKKYEIEGENLESKYKDWQKKIHPDLVHTKSEKEREYAADQSARVIDAYRTLTDPLSRAIYILKLEGVHVDEEERIDDLELLAEIMEIRETVEEAADLQALKQIQGQIKEKFEKSSISFAVALQSKNYEEAVAAIQRMTYYKRANEEILKKL